LDRIRLDRATLTGELVRAVRTAIARLVGLIRSLFGGRSEVPAGFVQIEVDDFVDALDEIEHIIVLMLENRSFDHMLGYLGLEDNGLDVDGLEPGMANAHEGHSYSIFRLEKTALTKPQDPCHSGACVDEQVADGNGGFASNYIRTREEPKAKDPVVVMGYYDGEQLPINDYLARTFCVCDRWFCSVRGATFPNRLYAVAGRSAGSRDNASPPVYHLPSFVRQLDAAGVSWRWYTHELFPTIWAVDRDYLSKTFDNVRPFSSPFRSDDFFSAARAGTLPAVAWIDPNFVDVGGAIGSNDDHPPSDVRAGQELILRVFNALARSPAWERTLLVITYDEHGGFFDHVPPPAAEDDDPRPEFHALGPRVPAMAVSPRARAGVSHVVFDHTSIIKTCLVRFCRRDGNVIPDLGARTTAANHLGAVLDIEARIAQPDESSLERLASALSDWKADALRAEMKAQSEAVAPDPVVLTDFQEDYIASRDAVLNSLTPSERARAAAALGMSTQPHPP
jgi:phospholipase C